MELEMRRVLAEKALSMRKMEVEIAPRVRGWYWVNTMGELVISVESWHPDTDWQQCGMVIDAMRVNWTMQISGFADGTYLANFWHMEDSSRSGKGECDTLPEAVSLAACRALEATNDQV